VLNLQEIVPAQCLEQGMPVCTRQAVARCIKEGPAQAMGHGHSSSRDGGADLTTQGVVGRPKCQGGASEHIIAVGCQARPKAGEASGGFLDVHETPSGDGGSELRDALFQGAVQVLLSA